MHCQQDDRTQRCNRKSCDGLLEECSFFRRLPHYIELHFEMPDEMTVMSGYIPPPFSLSTFRPEVLILRSPQLYVLPKYTGQRNQHMINRIAITSNHYFRPISDQYFLWPINRSFYRLKRRFFTPSLGFQFLINLTLFIQMLWAPMTSAGRAPKTRNHYHHHTKRRLRYLDRLCF